LGEEKAKIIASLMLLYMNDNGEKNLSGLEASDFGAQRSKGSILFSRNELLRCCDVADLLRSCRGDFERFLRD